LSKVTTSEFHSIQFDETTDLSGKSQVSTASLRRPIPKKTEPRIGEDFFQFIDVFGELKRGSSTGEDSSTQLPRMNLNKNIYENEPESEPVVNICKFCKLQNQR